ncbi:hypothetical protein GALL_502030 [mine drainage metagenome]|uniref:Uncharacterized protein n=1 Tax=mine drainage metagenome TaxID=410659 RepID=A0A1J5PBV0_9ZZZZ
MVRYRRLRLFRRVCLESIFSEQRSDDLPASDLRYLRAGVPRSPDRRRCPWRLCRPSRPQDIADDLHRVDDCRNACDRADADLREHRHPGADRGFDGTSGAGIFGRRRIRELDGISRRAPAGSARVCRELAICEPGAEQPLGVRVWRRAHLMDGACRSRVVGMAHSVFVRGPGRTRRHLYPQSPGGCDAAACRAGLPGQGGLPSSEAPGVAGHRRARDIDRGQLPHRLHADLRGQNPQSAAGRRFCRDFRGRHRRHVPYPCRRHGLRQDRTDDPHDRDQCPAAALDLSGISPDFKEPDADGHYCRRVVVIDAEVALLRTSGGIDVGAASGGDAGHRPWSWI